MPDPATLIGIEIGGTKLQLVLGDASGRILDRWRLKVDPAAGGKGICGQILRTLEQIRSRHKPVAVGVGFGGPVDHREGRICRSHQIDGWENFEIRRWLAGQTGLPVVVENDSNLAAFAEATRGAGEGFDPVFYFNLGSGVGGGLVIGGTIYHGRVPGEAEFGHLRLGPAGDIVESRCSGWSVDRKIRRLAAEHPESALAKAVGPTPGGEARHLAGALAGNDPLARRIIDELAQDLAFALSHVVHLLHPPVIVMGGGLSLIGEPLRRAVADALESHVMKAFLPAPALRLARLGEDAVPVGALLLAGRGM